MEELMKLVQDILAQNKTVCSNMQSAIGLAKELTEKAALKIKVAEDKETVNSKASEYLAEREIKIERVENVIKLEEESKTREKVTGEKIAKLEKDTMAFGEKQKTSLQESGEKSAKAASALSEANREWKILNDAKAQFEIDKKNMREDILKDLKNLK